MKVGVESWWWQRCCGGGGGGEGEVCWRWWRRCWLMTGGGGGVVGQVETKVVLERLSGNLSGINFSLPHLTGNRRRHGKSYILTHLSSPVCRSLPAHLSGCPSFSVYYIKSSISLSVYSSDFIYLSFFPSLPYPLPPASVKNESVIILVAGT